MADTTDKPNLNWPWWLHVALIAVLAVLAAVRLFSVGEDAAFRSGLLGDPTAFGGTYEFRYYDEVTLRGLITSVEPGGPLDDAGIMVGDRIKIIPVLAPVMRLHAGQRISFESDRNGERRSGTIVMETVAPGTKHLYVGPWLAFNRLAAIITTLIGCFILWRGWGKLTAMLLGAVLIPLHVVGQTIPGAFAGQAESILYLGLSQLMICLSYLILPFAMRLYDETVAPLPRWLWICVFGLIGWRVVDGLVRTAQFWFDFALPFWSLAPQYSNPLLQLVFALSVVILAVSWRRSTGDARNRNAAILLALLVYLIGLFSGFAALSGGSIAANPTASASLSVFNALTSGLLAPLLLAYAILRHKLFDLGFAVNRTLVYGAISGLLLVSVGLTEYAVKKLVPQVWTDGSAFISAGIALGVFLLFHRIHHSVEHAIERLFFHKWQVNEAALKRFVAAAGHMEQPEALGGHFTTELARFTGGAAVALYVRTAEGHYASATGETVSADDLALAAMRAELGPIAPADIGSPISAALALPMMHQAALAGFIVLGPKPTGEDYRPDEVEVMAWATHQIGLDLQAIRVRALEHEVLTLGARNAELAGVLERAAAKA